MQKVTEMGILNMKTGLTAVKRKFKGGRREMRKGLKKKATNWGGRPPDP